MAAADIQQLRPREAKNYRRVVRVFLSSHPASAPNLHRVPAVGEASATPRKAAPHFHSRPTTRYPFRVSAIGGGVPPSGSCTEVDETSAVEIRGKLPLRWNRIQQFLGGVTRGPNANGLVAIARQALRSRSIPRRCARRYSPPRCHRVV